MDYSLINSRKMNLLRGTVFFEVSSPEEAIMATRAYGRAVVVKDPDSGNKCMCKPSLLYSILDATPLPVIARVRTGHFVEAQVMELAGADIIDECEKLEINPYGFHIEMDKDLRIPGIMYVRSVLDIARAITMGASAIRLIGANSPTDLIAKKNKLYKDMRDGCKELSKIKSPKNNNNDLSEHFPFIAQNQSQGGILGPKDGEYRKAAEELCREGKIKLPMFACDVVATPLDAALLIDEGFDGIIVSNEVFSNNINPLRYANLFVEAVHNYNKPHVLTRIAAEMGRGAYGAASGGSGNNGFGVSNMYARSGGNPYMSRSADAARTQKITEEINSNPDAIAARIAAKQAAKKRK